MLNEQIEEINEVVNKYSKEVESINEEVPGPINEEWRII